MRLVTIALTIPPNQGKTCLFEIEPLRDIRAKVAGLGRINLTSKILFGGHTAIQSGRLPPELMGVVLLWALSKATYLALALGLVFAILALVNW